MRITARPSERAGLRWLGHAGAIAFTALGLAAAASAQVAAPTAGAPKPPSAPTATKPAGKPPARPPTPSGPAWVDLSASQKSALQPLVAAWPTMSELQRRKWIAISANYGSMHPDEQARLHERMTGWVALSPQQRAQARLNFAQTKTLTAEEKKAKWDAYQALSPEDKRKLASNAAPRPNGAATAVKPVAPQKLATLPKPNRETRHPARIAASPAVPDASQEPGQAAGKTSSQ